MVPSKQLELETQIRLVLSQPDRYVSGNVKAGVSLVQLLESLTACSQWSWISRDALIECIECSKGIALVGVAVVLDGTDTAALPGIAPRPHEGERSETRTVYFPDPDTATDGYSAGAIFETYPADEWVHQIQRRRVAVGTDRLLVFDDIPAALKVAWSIAGNLDGAGVSSLAIGESDRAVRHPTEAAPMFLDPVDPERLQLLPKSELLPWHASVQRSVWLNETLYLGDSGAQELATKKLFKTGMQAEIEELLVKHLADPDAAVKCNVLNALGMPAYSVGFAPGAPLPSRDERLAAVALGPGTIQFILDLSVQENDQDVIDGIVCVLSSQPVSALSRVGAARVQAALLALVPRVHSEQTARDASKIIRELRHVA